MNKIPNPPPPPAKTLVELLMYRAEHQKDKTAYIFLVDGEKQELKLTYGELDTQAKAIAARLQQKCASGERAILLYPPGLEFISGFFGCLYAGIIAVPVYPPDPSNMKKSMDKLKGIISNCEPKIALTTKFVMDLGLLDADPALKQLEWLASDTLEQSLAENWQKPDIKPEIKHKIKKDDLAFLQYTSGSTGEPKGVMVSHGNILYNAKMMELFWEATDKDIIVCWLPLFHDMGLIGNVIQPLYLNVKCIFMSPTIFLQKPFSWLQAISRYKASICGCPNFGYNLCIKKVMPDQNNFDLSNWKVAYNGAEPIYSTTLEEFSTNFQAYGFQQHSFCPCYGMAEATVFISGGLKNALPVIAHIDKTALSQNEVILCKPEQKNAQAIVGCGKTWLDQKILIVDPETLKQCPADTIGEIWVKGKSVAKGYWNNPEATEKTFNAYLADTNEGPFLRTEDLGFIKDGELFVTGRIKDLIIIRGRNHYPQDIELTVEKSHPTFRKGCCAAFAIEIENEERLTVVQEIKPDHINNLNTDEAVKAIRSAIAQNHELDPYAVVFIKPRTIPKTSSGKIQRRACKMAFLEDKLEKLTAIISEPLDNTEQSESSTILQTLKNAETSKWQSILSSYLQDHIARVLNIPVFQVDTAESVISLGLNSLKIAEIKGKIDEELGIDYDLAKLMEGMSISDCAEELSKFLSNMDLTKNNKTESKHIKYQQGRL
jgi:acyl-CoA synthetase (AMP-forming)/AMP-acid ligase II/acyl carrier protein